jgi:hypothetical protein
MSTSDTSDRRGTGARDRPGQHHEEDAMKTLKHRARMIDAFPKPLAWLEQRCEGQEST